MPLPFWLTAKHESECAKCHRRIKPGDKIFWFPDYQLANCEGCGAEKYRAIKAEQRRRTEQNGKLILSQF
ncbi:MAG: hypothetical protein PHC43_09675 [Candidatus Marinimicrobia bacterium]|jgi:hypothetical protein|nr:hypothetical protein [Candidatus Neomarinimicrobiota bacterium]